MTNAVVVSIITRHGHSDNENMLYFYVVFMFMGARECFFSGKNPGPNFAKTNTQN